MPLSPDPLFTKSEIAPESPKPMSVDHRIWTIAAGQDGYPPRLAVHPDASDWATLYGLGNREILAKRCLGLICSVQCPGAIVIRAFDAIRELRDAGIVVAGGFHSPMERECLDFLLRGHQPVIVCPARHPNEHQFTTDMRSSLAAGRLLCLSPFGPGIRRTNQALAMLRNKFVAALAAAVLIPHASPGGKTERVAEQISRAMTPVFTFGESEDERQMVRRQYDLSDICRIVRLNSGSPG